MSRTSSQTIIVAMVLVWSLSIASGAPPADLQPIGGNWFLKPGSPNTYYFRDGDRFVDLFSYHARDSNKDGIDNVRLSHDERFLIVDSQGYPNHPTALFPNSGNPNTIRVQKFQFRLPLVPTPSDTITRLPMGPVGMALNGVVFFNPFEAGGMNAIEGYAEVWLDSCCGHPQQTGVYHYHKYPSCVKSPFPDDGKQHSPVIGFAFDGYPVYGPYEKADVMAKDLTGRQALDVCNGHKDEARGYHYHVTPGRFPYIVGGYAGVPELSNNHELRRAGSGPIENNAEGRSRLENVIAALRPGTAARGAKHLIIVELAPQNARRPLPPDKPVWVQIGPYEARQIERQGNIVQAEITIPTDASLGVLLDCHVEFDTPTGGTLVFKKNDAFRVVDN
ncbi:MAG TPA: YHYH protein [Pirellulales bacterium]|nr:YHYH protein [Pirellulales bacterium]